jgi:hypothetical protein
MSTVLCPQCGGENPSGSRFCNLCGAGLPPATRAICPQCDQPNALHLLYCDHCGARLHPEASQKHQTSGAGGTRAFDLPLRPGDEQDDSDLPELNNTTSITDWLRREGIVPDAPLTDGETLAPPTPSDTPAPTQDAEPEVPESEPPFADFARWLEDMESSAGEDDDQPVDAAAISESGVIDVDAPLEEPTDWPADWEEEAPSLEALGPGPREDESGADIDAPDWLRDVQLAHDTDGSSADVEPLPAPIEEKETPDPPALATGSWAESELPAAEAGDGPDWLKDLSDDSQLLSSFAPEEGAAAPAGRTDWLAALSEATGEDAPEAESAEEIAAFDQEVAFDAPTEVLALAEPERSVDLEDPLPDWLVALEGEAEETAAEQETALEGESDSPPAAESFGLDAPSAPGPDEAVSAPGDSTADANEVKTFLEVSDTFRLPVGADDEENPELETDSTSTGDETPSSGMQADEWDQASTAQELPDWLQEMSSLVSMGEEAASPAGAGLQREANLEESEADARIADVPGELAGAEFPDWLLDNLGQAPGEAPSGPALPGVLDPGESDALESDRLADDALPDWLRPEDAEDIDAALRAARGQERPGSPLGGEWSAVLGPAAEIGRSPELPTAGEFARMGGADAADLAGAEIPEWLQPYKPSSLRAEDEGEQPEPPPEESGALVGLRGVVDIEPIVARPRSGSAGGASFAVTSGQEEQVLLLEKLTGELGRATRTSGTAALRPLSGGMRLLLTMLLLAAVAVGVFAPGLVAGLTSTSTAAAGPAARAAYDAVEAAAGSPVLVAVEYSPALAGELSLQTTMLLRQLAANDSPVLLISQSAAGITLAAQSAQNVAGLQWASLGFLPGDVAGLRTLGSCLDSEASCASVAGRPLDLSQFGRLPGLALVITGDRGQLVSWIEQVATPAQLPLAAAVTGALAPSVAPYFVSDQVAGYLGGQADAAAYERLWQVEPGALSEQEIAGLPARWLVILLLIAGNLVALAGSSRKLDQGMMPPGDSDRRDASTVEDASAELWPDE